MNIVTYLITVHSDYVAALLPLESGRAWALGPVAYIQNSSESIQPTTADRQAPFNYDGFMTTTWCGLNSKFLSKPTALHQLHRTSRRPTSLPARASSALVLPKQRVAPRSCSSTEVANPRPCTRLPQPPAACTAAVASVRRGPVPPQLAVQEQPSASWCQDPLP